MVPSCNQAAFRNACTDNNYGCSCNTIARKSNSHISSDPPLVIGGFQADVEEESHKHNLQNHKWFLEIMLDISKVQGSVWNGNVSEFARMTETVMCDSAMRSRFSQF